MYKLNPRETTGDTINFQLFADRIAIICTNCFKTHEYYEVFNDKITGSGRYPIARYGRYLFARYGRYPFERYRWYPSRVARTKNIKSRKNWLMEESGVGGSDCV